MSATETVAEFIVGTSYANIPARVRDAAKRALLDTLGVAIAGSTQPAGRIAVDYIESQGGVPEATVLASGVKTSAVNAAFANGVMARCLEWDNTWLPISHPTSVVFPVLLALGESLELSGQRLIEGCIVGLEVFGKIIKGYVTPGYDATAVVGTLSAAATAAKLIGLDESTTRTALGIAASRSGGLTRNAASMTAAYHAGNAASAGIQAALSALAGLSADENILDGAWSMPSIFLGPNPWSSDHGINELGSVWHTVRPGLAFKKYPCAYPIERQVDAVLSVVIDNNIEPDDIAAVILEMPAESAEDLENRSYPASGEEGRWDPRYCVALACIQKELTPESFSAERMNAAETYDMFARVRIETEANIPAEYENGYAPIRIELNDGRKLAAWVDVPHGEWSDPLSQEEILAKFLQTASQVLTEDECAESAVFMLALEQKEHLGPLLNVVGKAK